MRLLLHNPNTDGSLTARLAAALVPALGPDDTLATGTAARGGPFIGSEESIAVARDALAESLPIPAAECDAVLLACFGDLGVETIRHAIGRPMVSLSDACFAIAPLMDERLAIVTTSPFWAGRLGADVKRLGLSQRIVRIHASIDTAPPSRAQLLQRCRAAIGAIAEGGGVDAIVLGGAPLATLREELAEGSPLPIIDILGAAVGVCRGLSVLENPRKS